MITYHKCSICENGSHDEYYRVIGIDKDIRPSLFDYVVCHLCIDKELIKNKKSYISGPVKCVKCKSDISMRSARVVIYGERKNSYDTFYLDLLCYANSVYSLEYSIRSFGEKNER